MVEIEAGALFSPEDLAEQMGAVELLSAMWSGDGEMVLSEQDERAVHAVGEYLNLPVASLGDETSQKLKAEIPSLVELTLDVRPDPQLETARVGVVVSIPFRRPPGQDSSVEGEKVRSATLRISPHSMASRSTIDELTRILASSDDDEVDLVSHIMVAIERLSEHILTLPPTDVDALEQSGAASAPKDGAKGVRRSWYYLPSLSSRDKRADIVEAATTFVPALSGFLLAGKPGLIVLEHPLYASSEADMVAESTKAAHALDRFWSDIKSHSWGDIPSSHKKISEKLTEPVCMNGAAFSGFHDITNWPETERSADRGRKTDLSKLVTWLESRGIDGKACLERCLGVGWA